MQPWILDSLECHWAQKKHTFLTAGRPPQSPSLAAPHTNWSVITLPISIKHTDIHLPIATPSASDGSSIPCGTPAPPQDMEHNWSPFKGKMLYQWAHLEFVWKWSSCDEINKALSIWRDNYMEKHGEPSAPFNHAQHMYDTIKEIDHGQNTWYSFKVFYKGEDHHKPGAALWKECNVQGLHTRHP
jgi:hypothetical protein